MRVLLVIAALLATGYAWTKRYDGYQVLEMVPKTKVQVDFLKDMMIQREEMDFWLEPTRVKSTVHVLIAPAELTAFKYEVGLQGMSITVIRQNVQDYLDAGMERKAKKGLTNAYDWNDYNLYDDYMSEIDNMVANCPAGKSCETEVIGQSFEGRDLKIIRVTDDPIDESKAWFWMDSCIHARDWLACATLMNVVNKLFKYFKFGHTFVLQMLTDDTAREQLDSFNWVILPIFNPDGYSYSHSNDRFWRKSRSYNTGSTCVGTDLNRNHGYNWNTGGSSGNPCSDTYHGSSASSEIEVSTVEDYAMSLSGTVAGWLSFHTYGQLWLVPYSDCTSHPIWGADVQVVADVTCAAIEDTFGTYWLCGNSCQELYATSGTTADWAMGVREVKYSYTPWLRGPGFDPPVSAITPSFVEVWDGFVAKIDEIKRIEGQKVL